MSTLGWVCLLATFVAMCGALWLAWTERRAARNEKTYLLQSLDDQTAKFTDLHTAVVETLPQFGEVRYEVLLADWGPDFTGEDDTLHRWRWLIVDSDRALRSALGIDCEIGTREVPYMLGNSPDPKVAVAAALEWIEQQEHPSMHVTFSVTEMAS